MDPPEKSNTGLILQLGYSTPDRKVVHSVFVRKKSDCENDMYGVSDVEWNDGTIAYELRKSSMINFLTKRLREKIFLYPIIILWQTCKLDPIINYRMKKDRPISDSQNEAKIILKNAIDILCGTYSSQSFTQSKFYIMEADKSDMLFSAKPNDIVLCVKTSHPKQIHILEKEIYVRRTADRFYILNFKSYDVESGAVFAFEEIEPTSLPSRRSIEYLMDFKAARAFIYQMMNIFDPNHQNTKNVSISLYIEETKFCITGADYIFSDISKKNEESLIAVREIFDIFDGFVLARNGRES